MNSFVDQNGNFYPDNWRKTYGEPPKSGDINTYSLMKIATEKGIESQLKGFEKTRLLAVSSKVKAKDRVFIFVHGFNAPSDEVNESYEYMRKLLKLNPNKDEVVKFYWDGLHTTNPFGGAKVWFSATSFSQMAGEFGLRNLLNSISNKKIILISHSRGASVVLSALSSATFSESFAKGTLENHNVDVDGAKKLAENGNDITCIMLAPAIGLDDFKMRDVTTGTDSFCTLSKQVKKIHITINNTDVMLKKFVGFLSNKLKATDLGLSLIHILLLQNLCARLGIVRGKDLAQCNRETYPKRMNFVLYVLAEIAIAACDLAEVLGMAIGLNLLFGIDLLWGVLISFADTFLLLYLQKLGMRKMELFIIGLISMIGMCFMVEMFLAKPDFSEVATGFIPSIPNSAALYIAIGIIGATVMPHNLYLHSALVQTRKIDRNEVSIRCV